MKAKIVAITPHHTVNSFVGGTSEHAANNLRSNSLLSRGTPQNGFLPQDLLATNFQSYRRSVHYVFTSGFYLPIATITPFATTSY